MPSFSFPIGSILRVQTIYQAPGQIAINTHKFQLTTLTGASTFGSSDFLTAFDADMLALLPPLLSNDAAYYGVMCYLMNPIGPSPRPDTLIQATGQGTAGAGLMPTQTSGLISWYTAILGKSGQGRSYMPFPAPASNQSDGTPVTQYITDLQALGSNLRLPRTITIGPVSATFEMVLYQDPLTGPLFIVDSTERNAWATQRRRGSYGKANTPPF